MMEKAMSALTQSRSGEASRFRGSLIEWLTAIAARAARALEERRTLDQLARLDDRMLRDIGLFRGDIDAAACLPRGRDPIALLVSRQAARSKARCARRRD
jgi:uncharacterized protein YjiS (DUF1127 family)